MRHLRAHLKRAILRQIVETNAIPGGQKVRDALLAFQATINTPSFAQGRVLSSTSGNGQSAAWDGAALGREYTPETVFAVSEEFFEIYEAALENTAGLADDATEASSRAILAAMLADDRMQTVNRRSADFTLLNFPQTGQLTA